ncbi:hypothetical protein SARC_10171 [Sphaeroforma arctica JP610]|uniref:DUF1279 domain-containing protein n=1 Tax=Sphaeroforma arctica JP610 TaxID=667725 RepID=A0A0L0FLK6_9EUKA|nr:hypothetical protein SARC_10171 [Sphaeroforma arctica JP610]KNC77366.1 hypothetical protein SARC_10171 [Sphaeroforma arctica JP610]|eukprot:XP_014151268.1 hypothetical protein SARC_10171 [Sphaeroforma arctica JP610]
MHKFVNFQRVSAQCSQFCTPIPKAIAKQKIHTISTKPITCSLSGLIGHTKSIRSVSVLKYGNTLTYPTVLGSAGVLSSYTRTFSTNNALYKANTARGARNKTKHEHVDLKSTQSASYVSNAPHEKTQDKSNPATTPIATEGTGLLDKIKERMGKSKMVGFVKQYGIAFLIWYEAVWLGGFAVLSCAIHLGVIGGADGLELLTSVGVDKLVSLDSLDPKMGSAVVAAGFNELLEPIRLPLVIKTTPWIKEKVAKIIAIYRK